MLSMIAATFHATAVSVSLTAIATIYFCQQDVYYNHYCYNIIITTSNMQDCTDRNCYSSTHFPSHKNRHITPLIFLRFVMFNFALYQLVFCTPLLINRSSCNNVIYINNSHMYSN